MRNYLLLLLITFFLALNTTKKLLIQNMPPYALLWPYILKAKVLKHYFNSENYISKTLC